MFTLKYKSGYIHETFQSTLDYYTYRGARFSVQVGRIHKECKTLIGAKRAITKLEKEEA